MDSPSIGVVICTHNPRLDYLTRTLQGLRRQTLPPSTWDLLIVDNLSAEPVGGRVDLSWHPRARVVVEPQLGLTFGRRRGFVEAGTDLIVNLDDDVVLASDYLRQSVALAGEFPYIGVFGAQYEAEFERPPDHPPGYYYAAQRTVSANLWSNVRDNVETTPWGAGSVVRRRVAERYLQRTAEDPRLLELGRRGTALLSCEDVDIANSACDLGLGKGVFQALRFTHLIPAAKMTDEFKIRNAYWNTYSGVVHTFLESGGRLPPRRSWQHRIQVLLRGLFRDRVTRAIMRGELRAERQAVRDLAERGWL